MSNENFIRIVLGINDPNLIIGETTTQIINKVAYQVIIVRLQTSPKACECGSCHFVKKGHKTAWVKTLPTLIDSI